MIKLLGGRIVAVGCAACAAGSAIQVEGMAILTALQLVKVEGWQGAKEGMLRF